MLFVLLTVLFLACIVWQMFESNLNDNDVVTITLPYPIVTRYIRINPQRWERFISLRAEFYGCRFGKLSC